MKVKFQIGCPGKPNFTFYLNGVARKGLIAVFCVRAPDIQGREKKNLPSSTVLFWPCFRTRLTRHGPRSAERHRGRGVLALTEQRRHGLTLWRVTEEPGFESF